MRKSVFLPGIILHSLLLLLAVSAGTRAQVQPDQQNQLLAPLPPILVCSDGSPVESVTQWEAVRRKEVLELFRDAMYGRVPEMDLEIRNRVLCFKGNALSGTAVMKEVEIRVMNGTDTLSFPILMFLPKEASGPVPLFLGLNFNGNHTLHPEPAIGITESWVPNEEDTGVEEHRAIPESRGTMASRWPVELILSRGYGLATVYSGDIDPDYDDGFTNGIHGLDGVGPGERGPDAWGTIAAWAWGLSRAMDYLKTDPDVDAERVAVIGHSRMGKTALWAGAQDERFALVISNNSGCGGAALSRRPFGERVKDINEVFPHWFAPAFHAYGDRDEALPVDQHMLIALMAPRPVYVASAGEDDWADPQGEYLSLVYSSRVYGLYGEPVAEEEELLAGEGLPEADQPAGYGRLGYHLRSGEHELTRYDWEQYLAFADRHLAPAEDRGMQNPVSPDWIRGRIRPTSPRLILTPEAEQAVREKLDAGDPLTTLAWRLLVLNADAMLDLDPLEYHQTGRRLLGVSREAIRRLSTLALAYRMERDGKYLEKLEEELRAVCSFDHWNPSHFLDVAEMAAGVALAVDWAGEWLPEDVNALAKKALVEKALRPGLEEPESGWVSVTHNWNLVCHGGLSLAALAVYGEEPGLAAAVLHRAVEKIPLALEPYAPGGIYPEGPSYWFYATTYLTLAISACESALGTDFGFTAAPGVMESADFSRVLAGPSGEYYNYFDAALEGYHSLEHFGLLAWFARRSGDVLDQDACRSALEAALAGPSGTEMPRYHSVHLLELAGVDRRQSGYFACPETWMAGGSEALGVFRDPGNDPEGFFLAAKGGQASDNHGNMDAGSFILELDGVRWSVDPGNQNYHELEQVLGMGLWNTRQDSPRWSLLTKNNYGHSTLTVNDRMHRVDKRAVLVRYDLRGTAPEFTFDLTPVFGGDLLKAERTFVRLGPDRLLIRDELLPAGQTEKVTWQMITRAKIVLESRGIRLEQDGRSLWIRVRDGLACDAKILPLSPPPLTYDKDIPGLKRLELIFDPETLEQDRPLEVELGSHPE